MIPVEDALERILSRIVTLGLERVPLRRSLHRVLADEMIAPADIPPWANSSMDGYAVMAADTVNAVK